MIKIINEDENFSNDANKSYNEFMKIVSEAKEIQGASVEVTGDDPNEYLNCNVSGATYEEVTNLMKELGYKIYHGISYEFVKEVSNNESYSAEVKRRMGYISIYFQGSINGEYYPSR